MKKIFDVFTVKSRQFIVEGNCMVELMRLIDAAQDVSYYTDSMSVRSYKCPENLTLWSVDTTLTTNQWCKFLELCKKQKYLLVIKDDPDKMYFTKTE